MDRPLRMLMPGGIAAPDGWVDVEAVPAAPAATEAIQSPDLSPL